MLLHLLGHTRQARNILVLPEAELDEGRNLGGVVHLALFGEHHAPAAFGLDLAHLRCRRRIAVAAAIAVRHLKKTVLGRDIVTGSNRMSYRESRMWNVHFIDVEPLSTNVFR